MGKTRLTTELRRRAERLGAEVMSGACSEADLALPYLPFIEAVGNQLTHADLEALRTQLGPAAVELGRLFPQLASSGNQPDAGEPSQAKLRLFEAIIALLRAASRQHGLLLIIEDLHWADASTRELLDYMTRRLRTDNILVLTTVRSDELHRKHPLLPLVQGWRRAGSVVTVELAPLTGEAVRRMVSATFDATDVGDEFRDFMLSRSDGNPFVIEEMLKTALDRGDIFRTPTGWDRKGLKDLTIPVSVRDAILQRIERLEPRDVDVLRAAAVLGNQFTYAQLAALTRVDEPSVLAAIQMGVMQQLLADAPDTPGAYRFRHALTREAVYEDMLLPRRQQLHAQTAEVLRAADACSADIAHHLFAAGLGAGAVGVSLEAAADAMAAGAYRDAADLYERCLPYVTGPVEGARVLCRLGEALNFAGETVRGKECLEQGLADFGDEGDTLEKAGFRLTLGRCFWELNEPVQARREYEAVRDGIRELGPSRELALAYLRLSASHSFNIEVEEGIAAALEAGRLAEAAGADDIRIWSYNFLGGGLIGQGRVDEGLEFLDRSYREARDARLPFIAANATFNELWMRYQLLRTEVLEVQLERFHGMPPTPNNEFSFAYLEALVRLIFGRLAAAEESARRAWMLAEAAGHPKMSWRGRVVLAHVLLELDRIDEAMESLPAIETRVEVQDTTYDGLARGRLLGLRGTDAEIDQFTASVVQSAGLHAEFPAPLLAAVELLASRGDLEQAARLLEVAEAFPGSDQVAYVAHARGLLELARGDAGSALAALDSAGRAYARARAPLEQARALLASARAHHRTGDGGAAQRDLQAAATLAGASGAALLARLAREAAAELGLTLDVTAAPPARPVEAATAVGEKMVSVLFADVRGYTALTQATTPADMADRIGSLQRWATHEIERRGGIVDKFAGDAVMATFNAGGTSIDHALDALRAAIALRDKAALLELPVGAGIAVGPAVVGRFASGANVTVMGDTTNLASRLQAQAGAGEIVLSEEAFRRSRAWLEERGLGVDSEAMELKGFARPVDAYRLNPRATAVHSR